MVLDPNALQEAARKYALGVTGDTKEQDPRAHQSQLSFSAMLSAVQSGCPCEACQLLREAVDTMRVRPKQEAPARGPDSAPQA